MPTSYDVSVADAIGLFIIILARKSKSMIALMKAPFYFSI